MKPLALIAFAALAASAALPLRAAVSDFTRAETRNWNGHEGVTHVRFAKSGVAAIEIDTAAATPRVSYLVGGDADSLVRLADAGGNTWFDAPDGASGAAQVAGGVKISGDGRFSLLSGSSATAPATPSRPLVIGIW